MLKKLGLPMHSRQMSRLHYRQENLGTSPSGLFIISDILAKENPHLSQLVPEPVEGEYLSS